MLVIAQLSLTERFLAAGHSAFQAPSFMFLQPRRIGGRLLRTDLTAPCTSTKVPVTAASAVCEVSYRHTSIAGTLPISYNRQGSDYRPPSLKQVQVSSLTPGHSCMRLTHFCSQHFFQGYVIETTIQNPRVYERKKEKEKKGTIFVGSESWPQHFRT